MSFVIQGKLDVADVLDSLTLFKEGVQRSIIRNALVPASRIVLNQAIANLPGGGGYRGMSGVETELLRDSLGIVTRTYPQKNMVVVVIGPKTGMKSTRTLDPNNIFRQVRGRRASKGVPGVFGRTVHIEKPRPDQLTRIEDPAKIGRFVEGGHLKGTREAYPFLKPAFDTQKAAAESAFAQRVMLGIDRFWARMPRASRR